MIVEFSTKHGRLTLFGESAVALLKLGGHSGAVPGAVLAADLGEFARRLRAGITTHGDEPAPAAPAGQHEGRNSNNDAERPMPVKLSMRAGPLIDMIETAIGRGSDLMWKRS